jgi:uncharacterized protein (TIGR03435 family)
LRAVPIGFDSGAESVTGEQNLRSQGRGGGGWLTVQGLPLRTLVSQSFSVNSAEELAGLPEWAQTERFDNMAKAPSEGPSAPAMDMEAVATMLRALLVERFKMTYHTEDRQVSVYALVAAKPKMKKADPSSRTFCRNTYSPPGAAPGSRLLNCRNATRAQLADRLRFVAAGALSGPFVDATGIEGGWEFSLTVSANFGMPAPAARGEDAAPDPSGVLTIFEAVEKQLGLKLEKQKRTMPVIVIDHIEQKPTEN